MDFDALIVIPQLYVASRRLELHLKEHRWENKSRILEIALVLLF